MAAEGAGVHVVHGGEFAHVHEENGGLHDARKVDAGGCENRTQILNHSLRLFRDAAVHQLTRSGIEPHLSGGKEKSVGACGLTVGTDRSWSVGCRHEIDTHQKSPSMVPSG